MGDIDYNEYILIIGNKDVLYIQYHDNYSNNRIDLLYKNLL